MKNDTIRRSDAIKQMALMLEGISEDLSEQIIQRFGYDSAEELATEAMSIIPSADRPQEWIPCSERLPREEEQDDELGVLVTLGNGYSGLQYDWYRGDHWYDWNGYVLAWMPLPEPWKGADDEHL